MEDLYRNVLMLCPVCGNDQFTVPEDVENLLDAPEETQFQCSDCKTVFTKAELLENNQYIIEAAGQIPVFLVNGHLDGDNIHCTVCDDYSAVLDATERLIASGHTSLFYLYSTESYSGMNKLRGFTDACGRHAIPAQYKKIPFGNASIAQAKELLMQLHEDGSRVNGILSSEDSLAVGAVKYAIETGISVPKDLSIIGYNNSVLATCCEPELTSVDTRIDTLCENTVRTLMDVLGGAPMPENAVIPAEFIERSTTALF